MSRLKLPGARKLHVNFRPVTERQQQLLTHLDRNSLVVASGSAGTGKTYCAATEAARAYLEREVDKIVLTRPNVPTGRPLGAFPGMAEDKLSIWLRPILNVLREVFGAANYNYLLEQQEIVLQPMESVRGCSFENAYVLCDEAQQLTVDEIKAVSTRLGRDSKLVFLGDPSQRDVEVSGLEWFVELCERHGVDCPIVRFYPEDIVRSGLVQQLVRAFEQEDKSWTKRKDLSSRFPAMNGKNATRGTRSVTFSKNSGSMTHEAN
jgi:phosphate starvation-inducible PhoH-like protein